MKRRFIYRLSCLICLCWQCVSCPPCPAQPVGHVVLDGTLGSSGPLAGPNFNITADLGQTRDHNLFHSFSQFDLVSGDVATFSGPSNIRNILSRVTGSDPSSIDGTIRSKIDGANLFFMNPHGVIFGPNAQVDVSGSFAVTTADYIKLSDGVRFVAALDADDSVLSALPVSAFGFLSSTPGSISVQQSVLAVPTGKSFSLIGGDITVDGATIQAPSGRINLVSVKSPHEVLLDVTDLSVLPDVIAFPQQGQIDLQNSAQVDVSGDGGGQVVIRGGRLVIDASLVTARTTGAADGGGIDIGLNEDLTVLNGGIISVSTFGSGGAGNIDVTAPAITLDGKGHTSGILADTQDQGQGGDITVNAQSLDILNGARISAVTAGVGNGGNVTLTADSIRFDSQGSPRLTGIAVSTLLGDDGGDAGSIVIRPGRSGLLTLEILNGAVISADTFGTGDGGKIDVTASSIRLDMQDSLLFTGIRARTFGEDSGGRGGDIVITANTLDMFNGAEINVQTRGSGAGGNINITADAVSVNSSSKINAETDGLGPGGSVILAANSLQLDGRSQITAANGSGVEGDSPAGDIVIRRGDSGRLSIQVLNGSEISASSKGASDGGKIDVEATTLTLDDNAAIRTSTIGSGVAGDINLSLDESLTLRNQSVLSASAAFSSGGNIIARVGSDIDVIDSQISAQAAHDGGNITLKTPSLVHLLNGTVSASAGDNGGNIGIEPGFLVLNHSAIAADAINNNGGNITITANDSILLEDHSELSASALDGNGGDIAATAGTEMRLVDSEISAVAAHDGGNITLKAPSLVYLLNSTVSASADDNGGNITIDPVFLVLSQSSITADAINNNGGNISILADYFFRSDSSITADSEFGNPGTVLIQAIELDLSGTLVSLPGTLLGAESQLRQWCGARLPGGISSFLVLGKGGVSIGPDGPLPSFGVEPLGSVAR